MRRGFHASRQIRMQVAADARVAEKGVDALADLADDRPGSKGWPKMRGEYQLIFRVSF